MSYQVACACGKTHTVTAGDAGSVFGCVCGQSVEVPPLHTLRRNAGQLALSPDAQLEMMLRAGMLPETDDCVSCHNRTEHVVRAHLVCERATLRTRGGGWADRLGYLALGLVTGLIVFRWRAQAAESVGRDVSYTVPLRVCEACARDLSSRSRLARALRLVPVYDAVLTKYPHAAVTRAD